MNFSEELALAGEFELTDSELEMIQGGIVIGNNSGTATTLSTHHMGGHHGYGGYRGRGGYGRDFGGYWGEPDFDYDYPPIPWWVLLEYEERGYRY
jgi:hypothetical protein